MKKSRPSRFVAALIALFSVLFMQFAVASYVCPTMNMGDTGSASMSMSSMSYQSMPECEGIDTNQPNLCHAHDHAGSQSLDKPELPKVQAFSPVALVAALESTDFVDHPVPIQSELFLITRTTAPPLSIRNCCFRI